MRKYNISSIVLLFAGFSSFAMQKSGSDVSKHPDQMRVPFEEFSQLSNADKFQTLALADAMGKKLVVVGGPEGHRNVMTPLLVAASRGDLARVRSLLHTGDSIDSMDELNQTALHFAVASGNSDLVRFLVERGANMEARDSWDKTALTNAVEWEKIEIADYLIAKGANAAVKDIHNRTLLHYAVCTTNKAMVQLILDNTDCINRLSFPGETALYNSVERGCHGLRDYYSGRGFTNIGDRNGVTPLR